MLIVVAALFGFVSVAFGAYAEHALRPDLLEQDPEIYRALMTGLRYHQIHAVAALGIGLALWRLEDSPAQRWLALGGWGFVAGMLLFSGGIYLWALTGLRELTFATPVGGVVLMLSWLALAGGGLATRRA